MYCTIVTIMYIIHNNNVLCNSIASDNSIVSDDSIVLVNNSVLHKTIVWALCRQQKWQINLCICYTNGNCFSRRRTEGQRQHQGTGCDDMGAGHYVLLSDNHWCCAEGYPARQVPTLLLSPIVLTDCRMSCSRMAVPCTASLLQLSISKQSHSCFYNTKY